MVSSETSGEWAEWERKRNSLKTRWVVAVLAFWVTAVVMAVTYYLNGKIDLVLLSIALGLMVLGIVLKARFQLHLRKEPDRRRPDGGTA